MPKRVVDVGNCVPDHQAIRSFVTRNFDAIVEAVDDAAGALAALRSGPADLVLVNRKLDIDSSDGLEVIRALRADPVASQVPVMLVTNYPEYQDEALALGAQRGFGKRDLKRAETAEMLRPWLGANSE